MRYWCVWYMWYMCVVHVCGNRWHLYPCIFLNSSHDNNTTTRQHDNTTTAVTYDENPCIDTCCSCRHEPPTYNRSASQEAPAPLLSTTVGLLRPRKCVWGKWGQVQLRKHTWDKWGERRCQAVYMVGSAKCQVPIRQERVRESQSESLVPESWRGATGTFA